MVCGEPLWGLTYTLKVVDEPAPIARKTPSQVRQSRANPIAHLSLLSGSRAEPYSAISSTMLGKFTASRSNVTSSAVCPT